MLRKFVGPLASLRQKKGDTCINVDTSEAQGLLVMAHDRDRACVSPDGASIESTDRGKPPKVDAQQLNAIQRQAERLDYWGLLIGFFPLCVLLLSFHRLYLANYTHSIGDIVNTILAMKLLRDCVMLHPGLPKSLYKKMVANIAISLIIGSFPLCGAIIDRCYVRCNKRNASIVSKLAREQVMQK